MSRIRNTSTVSIFAYGLLLGLCSMYLSTHRYHVFQQYTVETLDSFHYPSSEHPDIELGNQHYHEKTPHSLGNSMNLTEKEILQRVGGWPNPTVVVGLPKAGTSSIADYFKCGGIQRVSHHRCINRACGALIQKNVQQKKAPLRRTGRSDVYAQIDVEFNVQKGLPCYFPQIEALDEIHAAHPQSTFILNTRNVTSWVKSIQTWSGMSRRLGLCNISGFPPEIDPSDKALELFFNSHIERVQKFVQQYPSHKLVEVPIDSSSAGAILENAFGITQTCWGHKNKKKLSKDRD